MAEDVGTQFLGHSVEYWCDLQKRTEKHPDGVRAAELLEEVIALRGRLAFFETRVREMATLMGLRNG